MAREPSSIQQEKENLHAQVAAFVAEYAGTDLNLDEGFEQAGIDVIEAKTAFDDRSETGS